MEIFRQNRQEMENKMEEMNKENDHLSEIVKSLNGKVETFEKKIILLKEEQTDVSNALKYKDEILNEKEEEISILKENNRGLQKSLSIIFFLFTIFCYFLKIIFIC